MGAFAPPAGILEGRRNTPSRFRLARVYRTGAQQRFFSGCRFEFESGIAEMLLQLLDPLANEEGRVVRAGNIERLAVAAELKDRVACVRADVTENLLHGCEVPVRREADRLRSRGNATQQLAGVARIDGNQRGSGIHRLLVHLENFAVDRFERHIRDAKTERVEQKRT